MMGISGWILCKLWADRLPQYPGPTEVVCLTLLECSGFRSLKTTEKLHLRKMPSKMWASLLKISLFDPEPIKSLLSLVTSILIFWSTEKRSCSLLFCKGGEKKKKRFPTTPFSVSRPITSIKFQVPLFFMAWLGKHWFFCKIKRVIHQICTGRVGTYLGIDFVMFRESGVN